MAEIAEIQAEPTGRLLPKMRTLALIELAIIFLPRWRFLFGAGMMFATVDAGVVLLSTRDLARYPQRMGRVERGLCRWSGPLTLVVMGMLVLMCILPELVYGDQPPRWFSGRGMHALVLLGTESAAIFATACVCGTEAMRHVWPRPVWRLICTPLLVMLILIAVLGKVALVGDTVGWP